MNEDDLANGFYRVSIKALILDETRTKFAVILEDNGWWELPGGGLDHGEKPDACLKRELKEEMGLEVVGVSSKPSYFLTGKNMKGRWTVNVIYEVKVKNLDYQLSDECRELKFVSPEEIYSIKAFRTVKELAEMFDSSKH